MSLEQAVAGAWRAFDRAANLPCRMTEAAPILFFGDLNAYQASPVRILTVGLNPSLDEFPIDDPYRRFPMVEDSRGREPSRYLDAMSAYFRTDPYRNWFNAFEPLLNGMGASYYTGSVSTALHTDICSPVATDPTWNELRKSYRAELAKDGVPLWRMFLESLKPQIVLLSIAEAHLHHIDFSALSDWETIHIFKKTKSGADRLKPYKISAIWYDIAGEESLFVFGRANVKPFMNIDDRRKRKVGLLVAERYRNGR